MFGKIYINSLVFVEYKKKAFFKISCLLSTTNCMNFLSKILYLDNVGCVMNIFYFCFYACVCVIDKENKLK